METFIRFIQESNWENLDIQPTRISVRNSDLILVDRIDDLCHISFLVQVTNEDRSTEFKFRYNSLIKLVIHSKLNPGLYITHDFKLRFYSVFNDVFNFKKNKIKSINISPNNNRYEVKRSVLYFNSVNYEEISTRFSSIYEKGKSYSKKLITFELSEFQRSYFGVDKEKKTLINPGEFSFLVNRFNLDTKRSKEDVSKYINNRDITDLQLLFDKLIHYEVFENSFLHKLNDFFIKERLDEIIKLGNRILKLRSENLNTIQTKGVLKTLQTDKRSIRQFENVWQKYFEKYLLYLIFSYQKIYPKIQLNVNLRKKFPDFIGINHYGGVDIIEIKTHLKNALSKDKSHDNYAFSSELSKSIIQTINYMDALVQEKFTNTIIRDDIKGKILEGNIYRPRGIIIISHSNNLVSGVSPDDKEFEKVKRDFTKLRNGLNNIQILTFDEILNMADNYSSNIVK